MTAAPEGGECSAARPGRTLPPGKTRYQFYRRHSLVYDYQYLRGNTHIIDGSDGSLVGGLHR